MSLVNSVDGFRTVDDLQFRRATEADILRILEITREVIVLLNAEGNFQWDSKYPLESDFRSDLDKGWLWVAVDADDGSAYAFMAITTDQPPEYVNAGLDTSIECIVPHRLAVLPTSRNRGVGQKFMLLAEEIAKERGYKLVRVDTNVINTRMNHIFCKLGYKLFGNVSFSSKPPEMRFNCYEKEI